MPDTFLVVCTANQCRSPLAAAALREHLAARGAGAEVRSAGTQAYTGSPATDQTRMVAARAGLDLRSHSSTRVDAPMLRDADVVLTLERANLRDVIALDRTAWAKTFTLKELVRRGTTVGPRAADESILAWLARVGADRRPIDLLGASPLDDLADPTTDLATDHLSMAEEVDGLTGHVVRLVYPR